jgi:hypothetical protein
MYPISVKQSVAKATDSAGNTTAAGTTQYFQIEPNHF